MHSFQPSRGRIFFEVLCAIGMAASCGGAWMQTGASALLAAAAIATLYGLVHFFDLFRSNPTVVAEPRRVELEPEPVAEVPVRDNVRATLARIEEQLTVHSAAEEAPFAELTASQELQPVAPAPVESRQAKAPRKAGGRRSGASKKAKTIEPVLVEEEPVVHAEHIDEAPPSAADTPMEAGEPTHVDEQFHQPLAPLFEPEPFVRVQQRSMFGRKAGQRR